MNIDIKSIGTFGISFSRDLDQTWLNMWRKEDGYSLDFFQDVECDDDDVEEMINSVEKISFEQGEQMLARIMDEGKVEQWLPSYGPDDEGMETDLSWTVDIDDLEEADMLFSSGNGMLPPRELFMAVVDAIRVLEPRFLMCFKGLR